MQSLAMGICDYSRYRSMEQASLLQVLIDGEVMRVKVGDKRKSTHLGPSEVPCLVLRQRKQSRDPI